MRLVEFGGGRIDSGSIMFSSNSQAKKDLNDYNQKDMREIRGNEIGMVFQEPMTALNPVFTIKRQLSEGLRIHKKMNKKEAQSEALNLLRSVKIPEPERRLNQYPHELSGGMRQRIVIAMALACKPRILIADEPTTALDVTIQAEILTLLNRLKQETGTSILFITHDMAVVAQIADRVVVMLNGKKVEEGTANEIFLKPKHPYTKALLSAVPKLGSMKGRRLPAKFANIDVKRAEGDEVKDIKDGHQLQDIKDQVNYKSPPLLKVEGLTTRFEIKQGMGGKKGIVHAVQNIDFSMQPGETFGLVGESGCGKSTTGRSILRLTEPTRGNVIFDGVDLSSLTIKELRTYRKQMQMIFQDPFASLNPRMMVGETIAEPIYVHGLAKGKEVTDRVEKLLDRVGLTPDYAVRYPHELSGGQRQRIGIARALALEPKLIIADEAVSALDVSIQAQVVNLMMELQEDLGLSYLFISHDMAVIERVSHRVGVMYLGEIVELGLRSQIFENPQHPYTKKLMSAVPVADPRKRKTELNLMTDEIPSLVKPVDYEPEKIHLTKVDEGHYVMPH